MNNINKPSILCVDDDAKLLSGLMLQLRDSFDVVTINDPMNALSLLESGTENSFDVLISDMHMPKMDGVTLLTKVKAISPTTSRILLTGNADLEVAQQAINQGQVFRFLMKPCNKPDLVEVVNAGVELSRKNIDIRQLEIKNQTLQENNQALKDAAVSDCTLGLGKQLNMKLDLEFLHDHEQKYSAILFELDYWQDYIDHYGADTGSKAMQLLASHIRLAVRGGDHLYQYGDNILGLILPDASSAAAQSLGENIVKSFADRAVPNVKSIYEHLTLSAGLYSSANDTYKLRTPESVLQVLEASLSWAKNNGCNQLQ